jgi:uncharacterized LabA/DUF88 family protein
VVKKKTFLKLSKKIGIETRTKDLQIFYGGQKKADWDVGLAVDAIKLAPKLDAVVIASGDGDFVPLVEYLKATTQVEVISFGKSSSAKLKEAADDFIDLCENPDHYLMGSGKGGGWFRRQNGAILTKEEADEVDTDEDAE